MIKDRLWAFEPAVEVLFSSSRSLSAERPPDNELVGLHQNRALPAQRIANGCKRLFHYVGIN